MFQFPTDTLANSMHEKKQIQSHIQHLITLTITKLAPNYTINHSSCTEKTYKLYYYIMHRNDEKPVCTQPRQIDQHRLTRLTNTPGATTSPLGAHNHKRKNLQQPHKHREKEQAIPKQHKKHIIMFLQ